MGQLAENVRSLLFSDWGGGDRLLSQLFSAPRSAGVPVTVDTAQSLSTVWACIGLISSTTAGLPLFAYRRLADGGRERDVHHPASDLLGHAPNRWQSAFAFREALVRSVLLYGNGYSWVERDQGGRARSLALLHPASVEVLTGDPMGPRYRISWPDGSQSVEDSFHVLHVIGYSIDGLRGISVIDAARRSLGLGIALEEFGASFFAHGSTFGGILSHPGVLSVDQETRLRDSLQKRHQGVERAHQFVILQGGMDFKPLGIPSEQAQFVESQKVSTATVARWFLVPPSLVNAESGSNSMRYSNSEQEAAAWLSYGLLSWLRRLEAAYNRTFVSSLERFGWYVEHLTDGLLRGDTTTRWAAYRHAIELNVMSPDEVRERENLGPRRGARPAQEEDSE